jgi:hypothetical protein
MGLRFGSSRCRPPPQVLIVGIGTRVNSFLILRSTLFDPATCEVLREVFVHRLHDVDNMRGFWDLEPPLVRSHYAHVNRLNLCFHHRLNLPEDLHLRESHLLHPSVSSVEC